MLLPRFLTLLVWALAAASVAYWGLRLLAPADGLVPVPVASSGLPQADATTIARVLGATGALAPASPLLQVANRFVLTGVVADRRQGGAALIAVDGNPPRAFRVGAQIVPGPVLRLVTARRAVLAPSMDAPASVTLELPPFKN
ncbi:MAG: general secretion pathway protein C [Microbacteriaceae bacterium]|nr:general secretion pathway protein C [Burkholderiaceae bacterium]